MFVDMSRTISMCQKPPPKKNWARVRVRVRGHQMSIFREISPSPQRKGLNDMNRSKTCLIDLKSAVASIISTPARESLAQFSNRMHINMIFKIFISETQKSAIATIVITKRN